MITHIWFDLEGTLAPHSAAYTKALAAFTYSLYGNVIGKPVTEQLKKEFDALLTKHKRKSLVFASLGKHPQFFPHELAEHFDFSTYFSPNKHIQNMIALLKQNNIHIGIYTSLPQEQIKKLLTILGLNYNDFTLLSGDDVAHQKPHVEGYKKIIELSKVPAEYILFVGDTEAKDILPAKSVGMRTLHIGNSFYADYCCKNPEELYAFFEALFKNRMPLNTSMKLLDKIKQDIVTYSFYPQGGEGNVSYIANPLKSVGDMKSVYGMCYPLFFSYIHKGYLCNAFPRKETAEAAQQFLQKQNPDFCKFIDQKYTETDARVQEYIHYIVQQNLAALSVEQLVALYKELGKRGTERWSILIFIDLFDISGTTMLEQILQKTHSHLIPELGALTYPRELSYLQQEKKDMLTIAKTVVNKQITPSVRKLIQKHQQKYYWYKNNFGHIIYFEEADFLQELQEILDSGISPEKELQNMEQTFAENCQKRDTLLKQLPADMQQLLIFFQKMADWRDLRKKANCELDTWLKKIAKLLAQKLSLPEDLLDCVVYWDIERLITDTEAYTQELKQRDENAIFVFSEEYGFHLLSGNNAKNFADMIEKKYIHTEELHGRPACTGKVTGKVTIINKFADFAKFHKGDILVTAMTRPEFVPLMQIAAAIVTDEGGLTCHAAIISRELQIPCIVGTELATRILKDGDIVEVDAEKGIVKKL